MHILMCMLMRPCACVSYALLRVAVINELNKHLDPEQSMVTHDAGAPRDCMVPFFTATVRHCASPLCISHKQAAATAAAKQQPKQRRQQQRPKQQPQQQKPPLASSPQQQQRSSSSSSSSSSRLCLPSPTFPSFYRAGLLPLSSSSPSPEDLSEVPVRA